MRLFGGRGGDGGGDGRSCKEAVDLYCWFRGLAVPGASQIRLVIGLGALHGCSTPTTSEHLQTPIELEHSRNHAEGLHSVEFEGSEDCGAGAKQDNRQRQTSDL